MIHTDTMQHCSDPEHTVWEQILDPDGLALKFLRDEGSLHCLADNKDLDLLDAMTTFLRAANELGYSVLRSQRGQLLLQTETKDHGLLIDGKTAEVLGNYLAGKMVKMEDRMDMTIRILSPHHD